MEKGAVPFEFPRCIVRSLAGLDFEYKEDSVVVSGHLVTRFVTRIVVHYAVLTGCGSSRGPGTAFPFALTLAELLCGPEKRKTVSDPMVFPKGIDW